MIRRIGPAGCKETRMTHGARAGTLATLLLGAVLRCAMAAQESLAPPAVPQTLQAPQGEQVILRLQGVGFQVYVCERTQSGQYQWKFKAPDAELRDRNGTVVGRHYGGPSWAYRDGSVVVGRAVANMDAPDPKAVPWLLLRAVDHSGGGLLSRVSSIQRVATSGGQPPRASCDAATPSGEVKSAYSAEYFFYAPKVDGH
jgi:hypothetical protein